MVTVVLLLLVLLQCMVITHSRARTLTGEYPFCDFFNANEDNSCVNVERWRWQELDGRSIQELSHPIVFPFRDTPYHARIDKGMMDVDMMEFMKMFDSEKGFEYVQISNQSNILYFLSEMPYYKIINSRFPGMLKPVFVNRNLTFDQFWKGLNDESETRYFYYSDQMDKGSIPKELANFILPSLMQDFFPAVNASRDKFHANVWIGKKGVNSRLHFDAHDNVYIQQYGRKRVTLIEPAAYDALRIFPKLHPSDRQSQVNETELRQYVRSMASGDTCTGSDIILPMLGNGSHRAYFVELNPGDILFMPKYYFHSIEAVENSVNINIWPPSPELDISAQVYDNAMPFVDDLDFDDDQLDAAAFFTAKLVVQDLGLTHEFVDTMLHSSYDPLRDVLMKCEHPTFQAKSLPGHLMGRVRGHAKDLATLLKSVKFQHAREVMARNFLQGLGHWTKSTIPFLELLSMSLQSDSRSSSSTTT